ncbi:hypothetical protein PHYPSEUDO_001268 [Phytophthora pseudosyringae]|uniref:Uncharacterized protein n=1 Tax=Phytophthora pseudosyringae TaxID=221518 RepID=A0A8T1VXF3_9STRA|nr:hypothetical protein PHYPSEUDO_001268 [Phytophthora pseudosyringae]
MGSEGEHTELLERARRLCLAARQLELPVLLPGCGRRVAAREEGDGAAPGVDGGDRTRRSSSSTGSHRDSMGNLPLVPAPSTAPALKDHQKPVKQSENEDKLTQEDARRLEEQKKRQERRLEKVKQAQERARARVARASQLQQQHTLRAAEQQQSDASSAAEECAEKIRRVQESRHRAQERIRMKRQEKTPDTPPRSSVPGMGAEPANLKSFHRKTIRRLKAYELRERLWFYFLHSTNLWMLR